MFATVSKGFYFDAAHKIDAFGPTHKCARLHGHTFFVRIFVTGVVNKKTGIVCDYYDIMSAWQPISDLLDHRYMNDIEGLEIPSTENLAKFIWTRLRPLLSVNAGYSLTKLTIKEGNSDECEFYGEL